MFIKLDDEYVNVNAIKSFTVGAVDIQEHYNGSATCGVPAITVYYEDLDGHTARCVVKATGYSICNGEIEFDADADKGEAYTKLEKILLELVL